MQEKIKAQVNSYVEGYHSDIIGTLELLKGQQIHPIPPQESIEKELKESGFVWHAANVYGDYEPWESLSKFFRDIMEYCGESHDKQEKIDKLKEKEKTLKESLGIK